MTRLAGLLRPAATCDWRTPRELYEGLDAEFHFTMDPCKPGDFGGIQGRWSGVVYCNPPYGTTIGKWIARGWAAARDGEATVVMLLPSRTDTKWWHDYCMTGEIRFIRGRVHFNGKGPAPFPSCVVIFRANATRRGTGYKDETATETQRDRNNEKHKGGSHGA